MSIGSGSAKTSAHFTRLIRSYSWFWYLIKTWIFPCKSPRASFKSTKILIFNFIFYPVPLHFFLSHSIRNCLNNKFCIENQWTIRNEPFSRFFGRFLVYFWTTKNAFVLLFDDAFGFFYTSLFCWTNLKRTTTNQIELFWIPRLKHILNNSISNEYEYWDDSIWWIKYYNFAVAFRFQCGVSVGIFWFLPLALV